MRLGSLELHNYRKFRDAKVEFPDGVVAIVGQNGAGKTTLLEAVSWALFGNESSVVRDGKEGVMSSGASPGDDCSVVLEFGLGGDWYRLARSMKGKGLKAEASLQVNGDLVANGEKAVSEAVRSRIGMDHKAFFISVVAKQKELNALADIKPAERKKLVLRMLGVDFLNDVVADVDKDAREAKSRSDQLQMLLRDQQGQEKIPVLQKQRADKVLERDRTAEGRDRMVLENVGTGKRASETRDLWEREEGRYRQDVALERRLTELRTVLTGRQERDGRLRVEIEGLKKLSESLPALEAGELDHQKVKVEVDRLVTIRERHLARQRTEGDLTRERQELSRLMMERVQIAQELSNLPDVEDQLAGVESGLEGIREAATAIVTQKRLVEADMERLRSNAAEAAEKAAEIERLGEDSNCPTCQRRMGDQYSNLIRRYQEDQRAAETSLTELAANLQALMGQKERNDRSKKAMEEKRRGMQERSDRKITLKQKESGALQAIMSKEERVQLLERQLAEMGPVEYDQTRHQGLQRRLVELEPAHLALNKAQVRMERLPLAIKEREENAVTISSDERKVQEVTSERTALGFQMKVLSERKREHDEARSADEQLTQNMIRAEGDLSRLTSELKGTEERLAELEGHAARHKELLVEQELLNRLSKVMKDFKENVISRVVPSLSATASDLLSQLTDGKYGGMRLDEEYEMFLYDQGEEHPLERFSGGESDLANLCLRLAISRMIMERSGSQMNFLVLDEIFGSQDQARKRNILETLGQLQKQFRQILLITHIEDVKDSVSAVLKVTENEDGSSAVALER